MIRIIKLSILAVCLIVPFLTWESRMAHGTWAFVSRATWDHRLGDRLRIVDDQGCGSDRSVAIETESGEPGQISRADLQPIDLKIVPR